MRISLPIPSSTNQVLAFGVHDSNLRLIERSLEIKIYPKPQEVIIEGEEGPARIAGNVLHNLFILSRGSTPVSHNEIKILIEESSRLTGYTLDNIAAEGLIVSKSEARIKPRTSRQLEYIRDIMDHDLVFCAGPAGTGKTYLAVAVALHFLITGRCNRIILSRPVIEAGENLGFLPGTLEEKIDPYLRPLFDAIHDMLSPDELKLLTQSQTIELAPLAYMRGRTLANAFIILDEAQNTSPTQMKMFLTRLGEHSKMVITGDISQVDLPRATTSGLKQAISLFKDEKEICIRFFEKEDVVRHGLVKKIIEIYDREQS